MAATLALWWLYEFAGPQAWWAELLRYLPYPLYLAPPALAALVAPALGWRWRVVALLAFALVLVDVMGLAWRSGDSGTGRVRLMTWNAKASTAKYADRNFRIARELLEHDPDIVVLQDVQAFGDPQQPLPAQLQAALQGRSLFQHGQYLVASRLPMRGCAAHPMPAGGDAHDYVRCTVTASDVDVDVVTAHLVSPRAGLNAARREGPDGLDEWRENYRQRYAQATGLLRDLAGHPRPLIVAGDLNAAESSPVIRALKAIGLRDAFTSAGTGYGYTHGHSLRTGFSFLRIDHILVGPSIGVADSFVGGRDASEHRPVIADLWIRRD